MEEIYYYNIYYTIARSLDELELWNIGTMEFWISGMRTFRNTGMMAITYQKFGIMESGMLEKWNDESAKLSCVRNGCTIGS